MSGKLEIITGNMFSGKSTELIRRIKRVQSINKKIVIINYIGDNRYTENGIGTHDNNVLNSIKLKTLMEFPFEGIQLIDSFFIDEAQFFTDLYEFVKILVDIHCKHVVVSGLCGDVNRNVFGQIVSLIPIADKIDKLNAYCTMCNDGTEAPFTKRINGTEDQIDIGGSEKYVSLCRYHYHII